MTEARWKLVVDERGVTIASDRFQFTANGARPEHEGLSSDDAVLAAAEAVLAESSQMEGMISELQTMTRRTYGQFCGLARALEIVGERWVMLIIRDLLVRPKTFTDLQTGLPRIAADTLAARLREMERTGIVQRRKASDTDEGTVYELTEFGNELEDITYRLGRWGARLLGEPRPEDIFTVDALITALKASFVRETARGVTVSYELRLGELVIHARITDGVLQAGPGPLADADLVIEPGPMLKALLSRDVGAAEALESGMVRLTGDEALLYQFVEHFHISSGK